MRILRDIEEKWLTCATKLIVGHVREEPAEQFYAAGFWHFYFDGMQFGVPFFGLNMESHYHASRKEGVRWTPSEWQYGYLSQATEILDPLYDELPSLLDNESEEIGDQICDAHLETMAKVCMTLTERIHRGDGAFATIQLPTDFVVGIFDEHQGDEGYIELIRKSIASERLAKLKDPVWE